uniref:Uncharacterized protein n=1 Tax=Chromera velia CCMP2878 TaxID=1169474 RepID=A0A0G4HLE0_9ALVE|eukprot:Cvel_7427.t1-p1 / transcript=Cvel_7427.t1 / gene=Cvel_7427 / organism=Chromera_velia_CCMP2878 / gene_product=hypothetical protein / transcript_product=hypothetical protein / location=Cvel_scaffold388:44163-48706(-) / protein_length=876 / sequence_SO=supercontig / SO=protein_coding / is_pseudo=false
MLPSVFGLVFSLLLYPSAEALQLASNKSSRIFSNAGCPKPPLEACRETPDELCNSLFASRFELNNRCYASGTLSQEAAEGCKIFREMRSSPDRWSKTLSLLSSDDENPSSPQQVCEQLQKPAKDGSDGFRDQTYCGAGITRRNKQCDPCKTFVSKLEPPESCSLCDSRACPSTFFLCLDIEHRLFEALSHVNSGHPRPDMCSSLVKRSDSYQVKRFYLPPDILKTTQFCKTISSARTRLGTTTFLWSALTEVETPLMAEARQEKMFLSTGLARLMETYDITVDGLVGTEEFLKEKKIPEELAWEMGALLVTAVTQQGLNLTEGGNPIGHVAAQHTIGALSHLETVEVKLFKGLRDLSNQCLSLLDVLEGDPASALVTVFGQADSVTRSSEWDGVMEKLKETGVMESIDGTVETWKKEMEKWMEYAKTGKDIWFKNVFATTPVHEHILKVKEEVAILHFKAIELDPDLAEESIRHLPPLEDKEEKEESGKGGAAGGVVIDSYTGEPVQSEGVGEDDHEVEKVDGEELVDEKKTEPAAEKGTVKKEKRESIFGWLKNLLGETEEEKKSAESKEKAVKNMIDLKTDLENLYLQLWERKRHFNRIGYLVQKLKCPFTTASTGKVKHCGRPEVLDLFEGMSKVNGLIDLKLKYLTEVHSIDTEYGKEEDFVAWKSVFSDMLMKTVSKAYGGITQTVNAIGFLEGGLQKGRKETSELVEKLELLLDGPPGYKKKKKKAEQLGESHPLPPLSEVDLETSKGVDTITAKLSGQEDNWLSKTLNGNFKLSDTAKSKVLEVWDGAENLAQRAMKGYGFGGGDKELGKIPWEEHIQIGLDDLYTARAQVDESLKELPEVLLEGRLAWLTDENNVGGVLDAVRLDAGV